MKNKNMVPAVDKALSIIEYMCSMERPVTQAEICKGVDVSATTGYRIVQSLMKHNWIRKNRSNTYSLSIGMISVLMRSQKNGFLFAAAQTVLDELAEETKLTCKLSIRQWNEQVAVLRADSPEPFAVPAGLDLNNEGYATVLPQKHAADGFFICKLRRHA